MNFRPEDLAAKLADFPEPTGHVVALSGGGDSTALLTALRELEPGVPLRAIHVCHQLQPDASAWAARCRELCRELGVPFELVEVDVAERGGNGLEGAAREARYAALKEMLAPGEMLLTGHHRDDQAETVLLQLMRGAGPDGLAGMAGCRPFGPGWLARPLLGVSRRALRDWLEARGRDWVEDPDNENLERGRNLVRHQVLPRLASRWPAAAEVLARGADNLRDARDALDAWSRAELAYALTPDGAGLELGALRHLDAPRRRQVLRCWLREAGLPAPERVQLEELDEQAFGARADAGPIIAWPGCEVRRYRGVLYASAPLRFPDPDTALAWSTRDCLALPAGLGRLMLAGGDDRHPDWQLTVRFRRGGERIRLAGRDHHTELKTLLQDMAVPPWERSRVPLVFDHRELAAVGDWCVSGPFGERLRRRGLSLQWRPEDASAPQGAS